MCAAGMQGGQHGGDFGQYSIELGAIEFGACAQAAQHRALLGQIADQLGAQIAAANHGDDVEQGA